MEKETVRIRALSIFEGGTCTDEETPEWEQNLYKGHSFFCAALHKRFGRIGVKEFLFHARRLSAICESVYGENKFVLREGDLLPGDTKASFFDARALSGRHPHGMMFWKKVILWKISSSFSLFLLH